MVRIQAPLCPKPVFRKAGFCFVWGRCGRAIVTLQTPFGFTGEQTDANGLLYLRARHYAPAIGAFTALRLAEI